MINIINHAIEQRAEFVHLIYNAKPFLKINKENIEIDYLDPLTPEDMLAFFEELLNLINQDSDRNRIIDRYRDNKDTTFSVAYPPEHRFRINVHQQNGTPAIALKIINQQIPQPEQLNLPAMVYEMSELEQGLILITGPAGNGKSTTLAAMINLINRNLKKHILSIENSIEFTYQNLNSFIEQRQIGIDTPSANHAIKGAMQQDVDVILLAEMEDPDTIAAALAAAESGHLVIGVSNTLDAYQTVDRIVSVGTQKIRNQLANTLIAIISQRLVPSLESTLLLTTEILKNNYGIKNIIREGNLDQLTPILETSQKEGMHLFSQDLIRLVQTQQISFQTAIKYCDEKNYFEKIAQELLKES